MSRMWEVSVINKGKKWIDLKVDFRHPDAGGFPDSPVFALMLLTDEAYTFDKNYKQIPKCALAEKIPFEKSYQPFDVVAYVPQFIEKMMVYEVENMPWIEEAEHQKVDKMVRNTGIEKTHRNWEREWDNQWRAYWKNPDNIPYAKYRIWVTEAQWIEHLSIGDRFDSAAYTQKGPWLRADFSFDLEDEPDAEGQGGVPGFYLSEVPPRTSVMKTKLIYDLANGKVPLTENDLKPLLEQHYLFLQTGGAGGTFKRLHASGLPINLYSKRGKEGKQLSLSMNKLARAMNLKKTRLSSIDFSGCIGEGINFEGATFDGALMTDGFWANANFENASLKGVDLTGSDLRGASFVNANLREADFEICNCEGCDFTGANIAGALFKGTNLKGIKR